MAAKENAGTVHVAKASSRNLPISTKHSVEISRFLRYKSTSEAKRLLEGVVAKLQAVPFVRFNSDMGHKKGMSAGRYPVKAAACFLRLVNSVEKNAENIGLNTESLKIVKLLANKASTPMTGRRFRGSSKRSHIEIEVKEMEKAKSKKKVSKKAAAPVKKEEVAKEAKESGAAEVVQDNNNNKQSGES